MDLVLVLPPRITNPLSHSSQPTSRTWNFVPGGQTLEMALGTAPWSSWVWIPAILSLVLG